MTSIESTDRSAVASDVAPARRFTLALFASTLFLSALLIFAIQPMFTKMVLPRLGGAPSVWSVAMVVFQTALFFGYVYAHLLARALKPQYAAVVHVAFLALVALTLPISIASGFGAAPENGVTLWLAGLFFASIGLPFIALAASAPLLQNWFIATGHKQAANPYVLYAASNLGSFGALMAYPFVIEPLFPLHSQVAMWSVGYFALVLLVAIAGTFAARRTLASSVPDEDVGPRPSLQQCLSWTVLAAVPSGLVIAVTAYITTDLAAAPFLWVLPLALYLLTFVAVFRERPWIAHATVQRLLPYSVAPLAISAFNGDRLFWFVMIVMNLLVFLLIALACHGEAYRTRPHRGRLTEFYLWISFGGALGGMFSGLLAPHVFNNTYEYPILLAAALLLLPGMFDGGWQKFLRSASPGLITAIILMLVAVAFDLRPLLGSENSNIAFSAILVGIVAIALINAKHLARFFGLIVLALLVTRLWQPGNTPVLTTRSFFGVHQVVETSDGTHRILFHGSTIHGAVRIRDDNGKLIEGPPKPITYYYEGGPISDVVEATRAVRGGTLAQVAAVGLGTGSLACYRRGNEAWTFFEIDPEVLRIARDPKYFPFLSACNPTAQIVIGDARLTLAASQTRYDLILLDAFSSDAIPIHLLTREAMAGYVSRLTPNGVIAVHVSNRHMELATVVSSVGLAEGLLVYVKQDNKANSFVADLRANALVVVLTKDRANIGDLPTREDWYVMEKVNITPWTDDYSDVISAIIRKKLNR